MFDETRYLILLKSNTSDISSHKYTKIKINLDDDLLLEKTLNVHNVGIFIKSVFNKSHNHYYYQVILEKCS